MRVLTVTNFFYPQVGGAERQAQKLSETLIEKGVEVKVVTGWWFRGTAARETINGVPVIRCFTFWQMFGLKGLRKFGGYTYLVTLFYYLYKHRREYDIIHIHQMAHHAFAGVMAGKLLGKKSLVKVGNSGYDSDLKVMEENRQVWGSRQMLTKIRACNRVVALSSLIEQELLARGFQPDQIVRLPNGVDVNRIKPKSDYRAHGPISLTFVGRLQPQKRPELLLKALKKMTEMKPVLLWELTILGDGPLASELKQQARDYGFADRVKFCGLVNNVLDYLFKTDIFVLPSRAEGLSNALLEALAAGLPCIASDITANAEVIQNGYNGLLTADGDDQALAEAILCLAEDETRRTQLGMQARQTTLEKYSLDAVAERYIQLYQEMLTETSIQSSRF